MDDLRGLIILEVLNMKFFESNELIHRLLRTIVQSILGIIAANIDTLTGLFSVPDVWRPIIVALVMAVLSPIMAEIGKRGNNE